MLINDRIQLIIKANSLTASEFASRVGVKRSNLSHVLSGRNKPSLDFLSKVIVAFPNVNASWLLTGETREGEFEPAAPKSDSRASDTITQVVEGDKEVEKMVVLYTDGSFKEYLPNQK